MIARLTTIVKSLQMTLFLFFFAFRSCGLSLHKRADVLLNKQMCKYTAKCICFDIYSLCRLYLCSINNIMEYVQDCISLHNVSLC